MEAVHGFEDTTRPAAFAFWFAFAFLLFFFPETVTILGVCFATSFCVLSAAGLAGLAVAAGAKSERGADSCVAGWFLGTAGAGAFVGVVFRSGLAETTGLVAKDAELNSGAGPEVVTEAGAKREEVARGAADGAGEALARTFFGVGVTGMVSLSTTFHGSWCGGLRL